MSASRPALFPRSSHAPSSAPRTWVLHKRDSCRSDRPCFDLFRKPNSTSRPATLAYLISSSSCLARLRLHGGQGWPALRDRLLGRTLIQVRLREAVPWTVSGARSRRADGGERDPDFGETRDTCSVCRDRRPVRGGTKQPVVRPRQGARAGPPEVRRVSTGPQVGPLTSRSRRSMPPLERRRHPRLLAIPSTSGRGKWPRSAAIVPRRAESASRPVADEPECPCRSGRPDDHRVLVQRHDRATTGAGEPEPRGSPKG